MIYFTKCKIYLSVSIHSAKQKAVFRMSDLAERLRTNPPLKQYRIGEVAHFSGLSRQTIHNYTVMGLIRENEWTIGGHRLYDESVFETLTRIDRLKATRTLREIRFLFDNERIRRETLAI